MVRMLRNTPNYDKGQIGKVEDMTPGGLAWVDFGVHRQWSFGESESTGCWCGSMEFEIIG